jgi:predicted MPP superfamily phosphohydrolase
MRSPIVFFVTITIIYLCFDIYAYQAFLKVFGNTRWLKIIYWGLTALVFLSLLFVGLARPLGIELPARAGMQVGTFMMILLVPKMILASFMFIEDITRGVRWFVQQFSTPEATSVASEGAKKISRSKFLSQSAMVVAGIPFLHLLYGAVKGKYDFTVRRIKVPVANLPKAFEGFTITQLSDIHTGSFDSKNAVERGIDMANEQGSDVIFFTGDLVNDKAEELKGFEPIYSKLAAPLGVFSILGNHDYGDYTQWPSDEAKRKNFQHLCEAHGKLGWNLLKDQHQIIEKDGAKLALVGVENWGKGFKQQGDLEAAIRTPFKAPNEGETPVEVKDADVRILLSHDPSHWEAQVQDHPLNFDLTLSGHTHGMQFGVEIPALNIKWSPIKWRYPQWAGLYTASDKKQHLYVNRGFGHLGYMGRAGILPEVTVLELTKA